MRPHVLARPPLAPLPARPRARPPASPPPRAPHAPHRATPAATAPRARRGTHSPRLFRLPENRALINRMGFNNEGAEACARRLEALPAAARLGPVGVNVGKNKTTPNEDAASDYLACLDRLPPP